MVSGGRQSCPRLFLGFRLGLCRTVERPRAFYYDRLDGHVAVRGRAQAGLGLGDALHDVHALHYFSEYAIAVAFLRRKAKIEIRGVGNVDEELRRCRVRIRCPRHGYGADGVLQAVLGLVADRGTGGLLLEIRGESPALDHETGYDAVEYGAVVKAVPGVLQEVLHGLRRLFGIELDDDRPDVGCQLHLGVGRQYYRRNEQCKSEEGDSDHGMNARMK